MGRHPRIHVMHTLPPQLQARLDNLPRPTYPDDLPVVARREEIARAIAAHQVVIVCGEKIGRAHV